MVDYLLSILVSVVVCLLLNGLIRLFRKKPQPVYRQPDEQRIKRLFTIASGKLKERGMDWLMLQDYRFRTTISKPGTVPLEETQQQLQSALMEILSHAHIIPDVRLEVTDNPADLSGSNAAGEYDFAKVIRVLVRNSQTAEDLLYVLCHEATHYIRHVGYLSISGEDTDMNEGLTEVTACLLGFSEVIIAANSNRDLPYLSKPEFQLVRKLLLERRAILKKQTDQTAELREARAQLRKNLDAARTMLEQTRAIMAVNRAPSTGRMSKASFTRLQQAMLSLENGSYAETLSKAEAALKRGPDEVHKADEQVLGICGDLFRVMLAFS